MTKIDVNYNFYNDVRYDEDKKVYKDDPDRKSPNLRVYHSVLWSKKATDEKIDVLAKLNENLEAEQTDGTKLMFSPDDFLALYRGKDPKTGKNKNYKGTRTKDIEKVQEKYPRWKYTIGGSLIFPKFKHEKGRSTINQARGTHPRLADRIDLTLECIRRYYEKQDNPLQKSFEQPENKKFLDLFGDFKGYIDFFCLKAFVTNDYKVKDLFIKGYEQTIREGIFIKKKPAMNFPSKPDVWENLYKNLKLATEQRMKDIAEDKILKDEIIAAENFKVEE